MDKANLAEWILRRLVSPTRASEIMGDLLETHSKSSEFRFWLSLTAVLIALTWRSAIGVVAAAIVSVVLSWLPFAYVATALSFHKESSFYNAHGGFYIFFGMVVWIAAVFSLIRFGPRSRLAQLSLVAALLEVAATLTYWLPHAIVIQCVVALLLVLMALLTDNGRKVVGTLFSALLAGEAILFLIGKLPLNGRMPGFLVITVVEIATVTLVECGTLSYFHRKLASYAE